MHWRKIAEKRTIRATAATEGAKMQAEDYRKVPEVGVTNPTIDVLRAHRTIRKFEDSPLSAQDRDALIDVARRAPTSSFRQQFSIIHVTDVALRDQLAEVAQQPYVGTSKGDLFMFVVDLYRNARIREEAGLDIAPLQRTNLFLAAMEDAVLAAHNMEVAAESMGLGTVYLGSLLRGPQRTIELLKLPRMTFPILGLLVGRPLQDPPYRPRLPKHLAVSENTYPVVEGSYLEELAEYDEDVRAYYELRKAGLGATNAFTQQISEQMGLPNTFDTAPVLEVLHSQGLCLN
jgi:hypothetical protein